MSLQLIPVKWQVDSSELLESKKLLASIAKESGLAENQVEGLSKQYDNQAKAVASVTTETKKQGAELKKLTAEAKKLEKAIEGATDEKEIKGLTSELKKVESQLSKATKEAEKLDKQLSDVKPIDLTKVLGLGNIKDIAIGTSIADLFRNAISGTAEYVKELTTVQNTTATFFDSQTEDLDIIASKVKAVADVYSQDLNETLLATNTLSKEFGISGVEAIDKVNDLLNQGANLSGDFLQQIREYSTFFAQAGNEADDLLGILIASEKAGIFDDKAADSIKEAFISIREGTQGTRDAFSGLGLDYEAELAKVNSGNQTFNDLLTTISNRLGGLDEFSPQVGAALADIFRGAGEDSGTFIKRLGEITAELEKPIEFTPLQEFQQVLVEVRTEFNSMSGDIANEFLPVIVTALDFIQENGREFVILAGTLGTALAAQQAYNAAQLLFSKNGGIANAAISLFTKGFKTLNATMKANPIGLVVTALGALAIVFSKVEKNIEGSRESVDGFFTRIQDFVEGIPILGQVFSLVFTQIRGAISLVIDAIEDFPATFEGVKGALQAFVSNSVIVFERFKAFFESLGLEIKQAFTFDDEAEAAIQKQIDALDRKRGALANSGKSLGEAYTEARDKALADNPPQVDDIKVPEIIAPTKISVSTSATEIKQVIGEVVSIIGDSLNEIEIAQNLEIKPDDIITKQASDIIKERLQFEAEERANELREFEAALNAFSASLTFDDGGLVDFLDKIKDIDFGDLTAEDILEGVNAGLQTSLAAIDGFSQNRQDRKEKEKAALIKLEEETGQSQAAAIEEIDGQIEQIERRRFRRNQLAAIAEAGIATSLAIVKALPNLILAGVIASIGLTNIALIATAPLPFKDGVFSLGDKSRHKIPGPGTGTSDSISARLSRGESVITAKDTDTFSHHLKAISEKRKPSWFEFGNTSLLGFDMPANDRKTLQNILNANENNPNAFQSKVSAFEIKRIQPEAVRIQPQIILSGSNTNEYNSLNYEYLAKAIAKEMNTSQTAGMWKDGHLMKALYNEVIKGNSKQTELLTELANASNK